MWEPNFQSKTIHDYSALMYEKYKLQNLNDSETVSKMINSKFYATYAALCILEKVIRVSHF